MTGIETKENPTMATSGIAAAFDEWLNGLDNPQATLTKHSMEILAKTMKGNMALRDAIILSVIGDGNPEYDADKLREYASSPTRPNRQLAEWCEQMMKWSFANAGSEIDKGKVAKAVEMLSDVIGTVEDTDPILQAQPFAIIGYMLWWIGDRHAMAPTMRALVIDGNCSLAAIVASAIHRDCWPKRN